MPSWAFSFLKVKISLHCKKIVIEHTKATITAPDIANFQPAQTFTTKD
jgi:hypothetical protein